MASDAPTPEAPVPGPDEAAGAAVLVSVDGGGGGGGGSSGGGGGGGDGGGGSGGRHWPATIRKKLALPRPVRLSTDSAAAASGPEATAARPPAPRPPPSPLLPTASATSTPSEVVVDSETVAGTPPEGPSSEARTFGVESPRRGSTISGVLPVTGAADVELPKPNMLKRFSKTSSLLHGRPDAANHGGVGGGGYGSGGIGGRDGNGGREPRNKFGRRRSLTLDRVFDGVFSSGGKSAADTPTRGVAAARKHSPKVLLQSAAAVLNRTHSAKKKEAAVAAAAAATAAAGTDPPPKDVGLLTGSGLTPDSALERSGGNEPSESGSLGGRASGTAADVIGVVDLDFFGSPSPPALTSPDAPPLSLALTGAEGGDEAARGPEGIQEDLCNPKVDAPEGEPIEARLEMWEMRAQQ